ncbi:hypothetical protein K469DRAFT_366332 [Zopfia rhizophila CBS 207.26]|uniref:Uncharacterized protein n=1 Tax=Zopfia rhizophila CBS 207.26 TaxID=1314779 RepID=A0A6A6EJS2_9PEZI|nr:hypothetical protein K469DRAFT_366332 [Zopfia rhizophila CBS 207.26]
MAHLANPRSTFAEFGGRPPHDHKLVFETPVGIRNSDQRSPPDETPQKSAHTGGRGSGQSTSDEVGNEDDDEDSSPGQEDEPEEDDDDPEVAAPSHGLGLGKIKRPAIRIEHAGGDESQENDGETSSRGTGQKTSKHPVNQVLMRNKKRTFSNVSNTSILFGETDDLPTEQQAFPRRKLARKLSNSSTKGLLTYKDDTNAETMNGFENAIESSDEEQEEKGTDLDDEDYSGVNLISDEEDMEDMEQKEEEWIINDTKNAVDLFQDARRLSLDSSASDNFFDSAAPLNESFFAENTYPDIGFGQFFDPDPLPTSPEPSANRKYSDSSTKRVRFDDEVQVSDSSSSSASELDTSLWPDLFMEQDKLPPTIYQMIENDNDTDNEDFPSSGSEHSYWDVGQDESHNIVLHESDEFDESSDPGSSGYETDMGDTTDEYDSDFASPPPKSPKQKSVLHRPSSAPGSKATSPKPFQRTARPAPTGKFIAPICGVFIHEKSNQAIAVTDKATKGVTFFRPRTSITLRQPNYTAYSSTTSTTNNSPRTSLQQFNAEDSDFSDFANPFQSPAADIMLTGIFGSAPASNYMFGPSSVGPPEAFYPFVSIEQNGNMVYEEDEYDDDDDNLYENDINIADFMDFGSDVDDTDVEEEEEETDVPATPATSMIALNGSTPAQPTPTMETPTNRKRNASDAMLERFDRGVVTAFRNNQDRYRGLACLPHDPDLRASVSRPIRSGRSAETLISPLRKRGSISKKNGTSAFPGVAKASGRLHSSVMSDRRGPRMGAFFKTH